MRFSASASPSWLASSAGLMGSSHKGWAASPVPCAACRACCKAVASCSLSLKTMRSSRPSLPSSGCARPMSVTSSRSMGTAPGSKVPANVRVSGRGGALHRHPARSAGSGPFASQGAWPRGSQPDAVGAGEGEGGLFVRRGAKQPAQGAGIEQIHPQQLKTAPLFVLQPAVQLGHGVEVRLAAHQRHIELLVQPAVRRQPVVRFPASWLRAATKLVRALWFKSSMATTRETPG